MNTDARLAALITRLIQGNDLTREEARQAFTWILNNETTEMQQGAFLAALRAKGETGAEVAGSWQAIYELDTTKIRPASNELVENSGTGMDSFKTFNISTAAAVVAAGAGVCMARHGARAITSVCGTVDMAEAIGVDVECGAEVVAHSIDQAGIGLFNGMSPKIHPMALGRILSQIRFGTTLNIAASLANPALPKIGVRGVYDRQMILPVARVMREIGYQRAIVLHGGIRDTELGMDEASVCGPTWCAELTRDGKINEYVLDPDQLGLPDLDPEELQPAADLDSESRRFVALLRGREEGTRRQAVLLNSALILKAAGRCDDLADGMRTGAAIIDEGKGFEVLTQWVATQNRHPDQGLDRLHRLAA